MIAEFSLAIEEHQHFEVEVILHPSKALCLCLDAVVGHTDLFDDKNVTKVLDDLSIEGRFIARKSKETAKIP